MRFRIPTTFECGGRTVSVELVTGFDSEDRTGDFKSMTDAMRIISTVPDDSQKQIFWHEAVHCILDTAGHTELSADEAFVERIGQLIWQVIKTCK